MKISEAVKKINENPMSGFASRAKDLEKAGKKLIHFEIGEPDFDTPKHIIDATIQSLRSGDTHYSSSTGTEDLRQVIAESFFDSHGFKPNLNQVVVAPGLSLIFYLLETIANPGEEVVVPDPGFAPYYSVLDFLGLKVVPVPLKEENNFCILAEDVRARITDKTAAIIINSPANPTGAVMDRTNVLDLANLAKEKSVYLLSDEVYHKLIFNKKHYSASFLDNCKERCIVLDSFSKSYAMTGWRIGYMVGPVEVVKKMTLLIQNTIYSVPEFIQNAGIAALKGPQDYLEKMRLSYIKRKDLIVNGLNRIDKINCVRPQGAFYVFPNIKETGMKSKEFADYMLEKAGVVVLPGSLFGKEGEGYVRLAYSVSEDDINSGLERIEMAIKKI